MSQHAGGFQHAQFCVRQPVVLLDDAEIAYEIVKRELIAQPPTPTERYASVLDQLVHNAFHAPTEVVVVAVQAVPIVNLLSRAAHGGDNIGRRRELARPFQSAAAQPARLPVELVKAVFDVVIAAPVLFHAFDPKSENVRHALALFVVDQDIGHDRLAVLVQQFGVSPKPRGRLVPVQLNPPNRCGKIKAVCGVRIVVNDLHRFGYLEAGIKNGRVEMIFVHRFLHAFGHDDLAQSFALQAPDVLYLPEVGAKLVPHFREPVVEPLMIDEFGQPRVEF